MSSNAAGGSVPTTPNHTAVHLPSLIAALIIMLGGTIYPLVFARADGTPDHGLAMALFWAMSAGLVRGVGFVPHALVWRFIFSGWSCLAGLLTAAWLRFGT
ncbi:cyd operon YbgE family protein [Rhodoferax sp. UBA5149]|uniref:cyd operon YbgE family protein n=1 Tax=Rhodoferax sp. UBA5149 TaxID=1947379 RepID=UPI0025EF609D|nr:cyd operon YbgE family protein [Rhodoferax sp. UBA5149]